MLFDTVFQKIVSFISFIILARLLLPEDFGIIALLLVIPNFSDLITSPSFESALIQTKNDPVPYLNSIWTFSIIKSLIIFILIFFSAPLIASFFHIERAIWAIRLSGIFVVLPALANVAQLFFFKDIDFKKIFIRDIVASLSYATVAVGLSIFYHSFWPLFLGYVAQYSSATAATYFLHKFRPRLSFKLSKLRDLFHYSKWIFGQNLVNKIIPMIENSLIGKIVGTSGVGLYSRAKSLATMPSAPLYNIITKVTFPAYSKLQDSYEKIKDGFLKSLDILFAFSVPFVVLLIEAGHRIILVLLGEKWIEMDILLKILILAVTINALPILSGPIFNALGKPKIQFGIGVANILVFTAALFILIPLYATKGAALAVLATSIILVVLSLYKLIKILKIKIIDIIKIPFIPIVSSLILLIIGRFVIGQTEHISDISFAILISFLGLLYAGLIIFSGLVLKSGPYKTLRLVWYEIFKK